MQGASQWQATPYTIPLGVGAGLFVALGLYLLHRQTERRLIPGAALGALLLFASGLWMGLYALELSRTGFATKVLLNQLGYFGIAPLPLLWFAYVMRHAGFDDLPRSAWAALGSVPVVTIGLVLTNQWHKLIWTDLRLSTQPGYVVLVNEHGVAFTVYIIYAYVLVFAGVGILVRTLFRASGIHRKQTLGLLVGGLIPAAGGIIYITDLSPVSGLNLPALAFSLTSAAVAWSVFRHRLFTLVPVAWESVIESMHDAAIVLDNDRRVLDANPASERLLTRSLEGSYGQLVDDVLLPEVVAALPATPNAEATVTLDGEERDLLVETTPLGEESLTTGTLVLVRDITERTERERQLQRQNERLDEFASVVSHDLRNPLTVACGYLELAQETGDDQYFQRVEEAHDRMETIIEDLLTLARQGETLTDVTPVALKTVAQEAWDSTAVGDATLDVRLDRTIAADRGRLRQLLENLFRNSVEHGETDEFASDDRSITVTVGALDDGFYVEDDGPGIPERERENVFERGYTTHEDGTGFGLPIVKSIADAHGWSVDLVASSSGGARFEFTDVAAEPEAVAAENREATE
ncbi:PAS domain-containing protein [Haloferax mediterranei ATCC 33500]|uniref:histidine kinase n=1 Tax=Haloferax mediterranei (strain ATCC 33500 / DSM 1411 / JCM 8866 / NBRC 14739 / NCIMB 2177 / R-4) TaxID=523841 RepID=I3R725_HALMT|nr:histidine kinase N-terminal 7TM domain-containing protein [Haloferax mediterranei]AFK20035.1 HTR-like protein [Haloferax mediterranei ATCC 33500]AHZ23411.1 chemotaxis protein CheY [Haloferax mediterranei ATCC 33500]ELZ99581.1 HTR-like protein [Haloferax mediterranei ATCC 33500]MDX5987215.1 histidine kinase N-terminal 7TM domain-containing protein [Haloferax mediterranei ATCC 33500]QCQ76520.1 PAS domain-containing protein [Haloferax mediterranei ATCC 33500]